MNIGLNFFAMVLVFSFLNATNTVDLKELDRQGKELELKGDCNGAFKMYEKGMHINPQFIEARFRDTQSPDRFDVKKLGLPNNCLGWNGQDLTGKSILIYTEMGLGDTIQFCRFIPWLKSKFNAAHVFFRPQAPLLSLMKNANLDSEVLGSDANLAELNIDFYASLLSLPYLFKLNVENIPSKSGYLHADEEKVKFFNQKFFNNSDFKIGICWQGDPNHVNDKNRSLKLSELYKLAKISGVKIYSIQKGYGSEQLNNVPTDVKIVDLGAEIKNFEDTAAIVKNLDVFVGIDTALIHLSGALNKKTILLLSDSVDWRWLCLGNNDINYNPWYDSLVKIRQKVAGDWSDVIENTMEEIKKLCYKHRALIV